MQNKNTHYNFQNNLPESARTQLGTKNILKISTILTSTLVVMFALGFFVAKDKLLTQIPNQLTLEISVIFWSFLFYAMNVVYIYITRKIKYEISWVEFTLYELNNLFLFLGFIFFKNNIFGIIDNGIINPNSVNKSLTSLRLFYFITMLIIPVVTLIHTYLNRKKYNHIFIKSLVICPSILIFAITPWFIKNFNEQFIFGSEYVFIALTLTSFIAFSLSVGTLAKIYSYGTNTQKSINQIFFPLLNIISLGIILGILSRDISEHITLVQQYNSPVILSITLSAIIFVMFINLIIFTNKAKVSDFNSFKNKLLIKLYIFTNLFISLLIIYLEPKFKVGDFYETTILIALFPIIFMVLMFFVLSHLKIIIFERMQTLSIVIQFVICSLIVCLSGISYTLEESLIINKWLGRALWTIFLTFYLVVEIVAFIPDVISVLLIKKMHKGAKHV